MITTKPPVKGNKKKAEKLLIDARNEKEAELKYLRKAQKNGYRDEDVEFTPIGRIKPVSARRGGLGKYPKVP